MTARLSDALLPAGLAADLPADPGIVPAFYSATDTGEVWRWDGATWAIWALALPEGTTDGDVPVWDATAGLWVPGTGGGGGGGLVDFARAKRTSGDIAFAASGAFANVDTGLDLVMNASVGDVIEARMAMRVIGSNFFVADFHTLVAGAPVNSMAADGSIAGTVQSFPGWSAGVVPASPGAVLTASKQYTLVAGDISSGTVTLRLRAKSGASQTISASDPILYVEATNLGPQL